MDHIHRATNGGFVHPWRFDVCLYWLLATSVRWFPAFDPRLASNVIAIDLFQEGVAIILRVTRDDSWLAEEVANTYSRLTLGCLVSIVREFLTCQ